MSYLKVNLLIIVVPLLLSFESKIRFVRYWPAVLVSILVVGTLYTYWDNYVTRRGDWSFNSEHLSGKQLFGLPLEEILFFVTAPFSCIFIYEAVRYFFPPFHVPYSLVLSIFLAGLMIYLAYLFRFQNYTRTVMIVFGFTILTLGLLAQDMLSSGHFWVAILISYIPFMIFNGYLTSAPVVCYNPKSIIGMRITTIPVEDFLYNFSMLASYFWIYILVKQFIGL